MLKSLAAQAAEDHPAAITALSEALSLARPQGYIRVFADEGLPMAALLNSLIRAQQRGRVAALSGPAREHMDRVVQAFHPSTGQAANASPTATGLIDHLTRRELEVLGFIAAGSHALDTVRKHMSNVLQNRSIEPNEKPWLAHANSA